MGCNIPVSNDTDSKQTPSTQTNTSTSSSTVTKSNQNTVPKEELIASFAVKLRAEPGTINAGVAASYLNGYVIKAGDTFSFNDATGERTKEKGYVLGSLPVPDGKGGYTDTKQYGSGVCRESDLLATLARIAGLQQIEIHKHDVTPWYFSINSGLADSTVYFGLLDNKFKNTKNYDIKIKTWLDSKNSVLYGEFYKLPTN
jgi:vancomycin resistance protein YoaR